MKCQKKDLCTGVCRMLSIIVTTVYKGNNLGQIKMEHKCPLRPKSRMKPREGDNTPCSHYSYFFFGWSQIFT